MPAPFYNAYFMTPTLRGPGQAKPSNQWKRCPTVILGFSAGLWLAPSTEDHLPADLQAFSPLPILWACVSASSVTAACPRAHSATGAARVGKAVLAVPLIIGFVWFSVVISPFIAGEEIWFFNGSARQWNEPDVGIKL